MSNATYQDDNELESSSDESEEGEEIVVTAKRLPQVLYLSSGGSSTMFRTADIQPEFRFPDYSLINDGLNPYEIVGNGLKAIGEAIATLTEAASFALPASEETRLNALANTLKTLGTSLQAGTIDVSTAKSAMSDALSVAFNELGGLGIGVLMSSLASYASSVAPMPAHVKAGIIVGAGVFGFLVDSAIGDSGIYDRLADLITDGLFSGAEALVDVLTNIYDSVTSAVNPVTGSPIGAIDLSSYDPSPSNDDYLGSDPAWSSSPEFHYASSSAFEVGNYYGGETGPGPKRPLTPDEPPAAPIGGDAYSPEALHTELLIV